MNIETLPIQRLIPYARNARTHSDAQVAQIAASIREFGFTNPVLIDADDGIIAGHGRVLAARKLGMVEAPCVRLGYLTEIQKRAYVIADNKLALNASWDDAMLGLELSALRIGDFDLTLTGFNDDEIDLLLDGVSADGNDADTCGDDTYSRKIKAPIYEIKGDKPEISDLYESSKTDALMRDISASDIPDDIAEFLRHAAQRHTVFHFGRIAEYYAHASVEIQSLMERSALVIIDFNAAIENGFVYMTERLGDLIGIEEGDIDDDA